MGKCVRIRSSSKPPPPGEPAAAYLTLRSSRRVPVAAAACSPPGRGRHRRGARTSCRCGDSPGQRKSSAALRGERHGKEPPARGHAARDDSDRGDCSSETTNTPFSGDDAVKREQGSKKKGQPSPLPPVLEAEMEAFFAAAELAERRRFAEAYNYDVALDRPLEGRFEWTPVST
ncbi:unnamed protein product [Urochloa decumbens]|uniref:Cyclin-dependent kinase inhibitor domain-containing protein n=1 Tax=Urochloa decumbens TaxID=240449 RepID=A0ABC9AT53_9POAL